jgi:hypothetical protein
LVSGNFYHPEAGDNATPDLIISMPVTGGKPQADYQEKIDPLFLIGSMTGFADPNGLISIPGPVQSLITLLRDDEPIAKRVLAGAMLVVSVGPEKLPCKVFTKIPRSKLKFAPRERGRAPVGSDGKSVELHHIDQKLGNASPRDEMTRTEHRGEGNFTANHANTGSEPSAVDRAESSRQHREYWKQQWDAGQFDHLMRRPNRIKNATDPHVELPFSLHSLRADVRGRWQGRLCLSKER